MLAFFISASKQVRPYITLKVFLCNSHHLLKCMACSKLAPKYMKPEYRSQWNDSGELPKKSVKTSKLTLRSNDSCWNERSTFLYFGLSIYLSIWAFWKVKNKNSAHRFMDRVVLRKNKRKWKRIISFTSKLRSLLLRVFSTPLCLFLFLTSGKKRR